MNKDEKIVMLKFDVDVRTVNTEMQVNRESDFRIMENERHEILTEKFSIHFFELRKPGKCRKNRRMEDRLYAFRHTHVPKTVLLWQKTVRHEPFFLL